MSQARLYALSCGAFRLFDKSVFTPGCNQGVRADFPICSFLITHPKGNVLFDTGCHPDTANNPASRWGHMAKSAEPLVGEGDDVVTQLARIGLRPDDVDVVVNSHLHTDHCGGNQFFPKAKFYLQPEELEAARDPANAALYVRADWDHALDYRIRSGDFDIFGDRSLEIVRTVGHTRGHQSLVARLPTSGTLILTGGASTVAYNIEQMRPARAGGNTDDLLRSLQRLRSIQAAEDAFVVPGHDADIWRDRIKHPPAYYD